MQSITKQRKLLTATVCLGLCLTPELAVAWQKPQDMPLQNQSNIPQQVQPQPAQPQAAPDQQPNPDMNNDLPDAPQNTTSDQAQAPAAQPAASQQPVTTIVQQQKPSAPGGVAAAGKSTTYGGAASRPAGTAIAPAKQRQVRSLLIKLGLIGAAGVALGTVYGLSRSSPSTPPGSGH